MKNSIVIILMLWAGSLTAQMITPEVILSSGGSYQNDYAFMDVSIGEVVTETMVGANYLFTNGFQQGHYRLSYIENDNLININLTLFPNPATDFVNVQIQTTEDFDLQYQICDISGRLLMQGLLTSQEGIKSISLETLSPGSYYMSFYHNNAPFYKSFKLIKF